MSLDEQVPQPQQQNFQAAPAPQAGTSGLAIAGLILAFLTPPLGFLLSLIAVFKTGAGRAKGRGLAITGLIVSTLIIVSVTTVAVVFLSSTVADPGCAAAKDAIIKGAGSADASSLKGTIDELNAAAAKAKHDNVRDAVKAMADDYSQLENATKTGEIPPGIMDKVSKDAATIDSLCTIGS
ncbi:DUF4190 domain-containing protein [Krasilnikovia sp. MM14-A1259]|uniref:DUF4190 domain-containing protein n=1 Tax=Krasilnikovia sp. MM14-A1259 TaxID=3373539 RepID=UPI00381A8775